MGAKAKPWSDLQWRQKQRIVQEIAATIQKHAVQCNDVELILADILKTLASTFPNIKIEENNEQKP